MSIPLPLYLKYILDDNLSSFLLISLTSVMVSVTAIYFVGLDISEKKYIKSKMLEFKGIVK